MKWSLASPKNLGIRPLLRYPQEYGLPAFFMLKFALFSLASNHFLTPENLSTVALQTSIIAAIAAGTTFAILLAVLPDRATTPRSMRPIHHFFSR